MSRVLIEERIGETRAAQFDDTGCAVRVFIERWSDRDHRAWRGKRVSTIVRSAGPEPGGVFVDLETGGDGFLRLGKSAPVPHQGERIDLVVEVEAQNGKLPRLRRPSDGEPVFASAFEAWCASLKPRPSDIQNAQSAADRLKLDDASRSAVTSVIGLDGGGCIRFTPAGTLTAIDVDSAGRPLPRMTGKAHFDWSLDLNLLAACAAARWFAVSEMGGLGVLDCVAPLKGASAHAIKARFESVFQSSSRRQAVVLPPSRLGLMEISIERAFQPLAERLETIETEALDAIAALEREARAQPAAHLTISAPAVLVQWLSDAPFDWREALAGQFGARFALDPTPSDRVSVWSS